MESEELTDDNYDSTYDGFSVLIQVKAISVMCSLVQQYMKL